MRASTSLTLLISRCTVIALLGCALISCSSDDAPAGDAPIDQTPLNPNIDLTISGRITFDYVPHRESNNALNYLATEERPCRGVTVQLLNDRGQLLRETRSDENGQYQLGSPANIPVRVRVVAELEREDTVNWQIRVTDNTDNNSIYAMAGSLTNSGTADSVRDLHAPSGWVDDEYNAARVAAPYAILDAIYDALSLLESVDTSINLTPAQIRWSENNVSNIGSLSEGEIGTSFFDTVSGNIYLLGYADNDTDEYDRSVIQHEFAHLIESQLLRSDNIGGGHRIDELLDIRIAFSEAWGNAFAGMAANDPVYRDSFGPNQDLGFFISLENVETLNPGWFSEGSILNILFDLFDDTSEDGDDLNIGFEPIYRSLHSANVRNTDAMMGFHVFSSELMNYLDPSEQGAYSSLLASHQIFGQDAFALGETNNGGNADALPLYLPLTFANSVEVCTNKQNGEWNKIANRRFLSIDLPDTSTRTVSINVGERGGQQVNAWVDVHRRGTFLRTLNLATYNIDEERFTPTSAGVHILEYYEESNVDEVDNTGGAYCATLTIN